MVEKNDQKKCRDISTEIQEILAKWGKYFFYYYPKEHRIRPSEFAARHMGIVENATDLEHSILMDRIMEKEKLLKLFQDIDHGAKTVSAKIQSSGKDMVYQISMGRIQGGSQKQPEYVLGLIEQIRAGKPIEQNAFLVMMIALCGFTILFGRFFCGYACAFGTLEFQSAWRCCLFLCC